MKNILLFVTVALFLSGCSSIKTNTPDKEYVVQCHRLLTSDESCAEKAEDKCPKGYEIEKSVFKYILLQGPQRVVTIVCK